jgi:flavin-dependent dehydrogenase
LTPTIVNDAEQPSERWDVVVVGAGPSGALAARQIALRGLRVLLVERKEFPRDKVCGGCVGRRAVELLESLDLGDVTAGQGGLPIARMRVYRGSRRLVVPLSGGVAISRRAFDAALVDAALRAGVVFRPGTDATVTSDDAQDDENWREVVLQPRRQQATTIAARVVLAADGLGQSSLRQMPAFRSRVSGSARIGLGALMPVEDADYEPGTVHMAVGRHGYAGLVRVEDGRLNVAAAVDGSFLRDQRSPAATVAAILSEARLPIPAGFERAGWQGTPPLTRHTPTLAGKRLFVLGDAAGYVEPFTGEGIAWALTAAVAVAPLATQACGVWDDRLAMDWHRAYSKLVGRRQHFCRALAAVLRRRWAVTTAWSGFSLAPGLFHPLVRYLEHLPIELEASR